MIPYLIHAAILLAIFWIFFWIFIRKETYYRLNRYFLVSVIIGSLILPLITVPESLSLRASETQSQNALLLDEPLNLNDQKNLIPAQKNTFQTPMQEVNTLERPIPVWRSWKIESVLWVCYMIGVSIFLITFLIQFFLLLYRRRHLEYVQDDEFRIYELTDDQAPFSFLTWIFINPTQYDFDTYEQILEHEKVHVSQYHFLDKFLAEFLVIVFWFNPFAWLYRKSITNNIEFLTDFEMLGKGVEKETYQYSLLKVSVPQYALNLTTSYNESFLKERIIMMNTKKSSAKSSWKYLLTLPLAILCLASLNAVDSKDVSPHNVYDTQLTSEYSDVDTDTPVEHSIKDLTSNLLKSKNQAGQQVELNKEDYEKKIKAENREDITERNNETSLELEKGKPGFWKGSVNGNKVCLALNYMTSRNHQQQHCFSRASFTNVSENSEGIFVLNRDAGQLTLKGEFEDGLGEGRFDFEFSPDFQNFLNDQGYGNADEDELLQLFMSDINMDFISSAKGEINDLSLNKLIELGIHTNGASDIEELMRICKKIGHENPKAKELIEMSIHGVSEDFVDGLLQISSEDLTLRKVIEAKIHNVDANFVKSLKENGYPNVSLGRVIEMAIHNVKSDDIEALAKAGYKNIDAKYLIEFAIHGVDATYIKALADLGLNDLKPREIVEFAIHNVSADYIKSMRDAGYNNISASRLVESKIHNVSPSDAAEYKKMGLDLSINKLIEFNIHNVSPSYVEDLQQLGIQGLSASKILEGKIHNVSTEQISEYQKLGVTGLTWGKILEAKIHGVSAAFITKARDAGYSPKDLKDYTELKIMGIR